MAGATFSTGRGPILMAVIWTWAGVATILYVLRAINASRAPSDQRSFFGLRWDFVWVTIGYACSRACAHVAEHDLSNSFAG